MVDYKSVGVAVVIAFILILIFSISDTSSGTGTTINNYNITNVTDNITTNITNNITNNITGTGSTQYVAYWTNSTNLLSSTLSYNTTNYYLGINKTNPSSNLEINGNMTVIANAIPPTVAGTGNKGLDALFLIAGKGGNSSGGAGGKGGGIFLSTGMGGNTSVASFGGAGGDITMVTAQGADSTSGSFSMGGNGGALNIFTGSAGNGVFVGGTGGALNVYTGHGGNVRADSGIDSTAGGGGPLKFYSGNGGNATNASTIGTRAIRGGDGGILTFFSGKGGNSLNLSGGAGGQFQLSSGNGGDGKASNISASGTPLSQSGQVLIQSGFSGSITRKDGTTLQSASGAGISITSAGKNGVSNYTYTRGGDGGSITIYAGQASIQGYNLNGTGGSVYINGGYGPSASYRFSTTKNIVGNVILNGYNTGSGFATTGRTGIGLEIPVDQLHQDSGVATATHHRFTANTTTGTSITDGTTIGISATGETQIRQYENLNISIWTSNTERIRISNTGYLTLRSVTYNACSTALEGAMYYNSTSKTFYGCNSTAWNVLG